ncbi:diguanylate cyclase/phosphodiesterase (GGDEF & EAL domain protein) with PAS/PAC sensor(s) [Pseudohaliea rubra DSM 19751]|uniref:Diguanylate cyclase/phosphodiesterase (GGDEF & EAL domain protein) with PAS/PAC sensor(S) n=1 Tax=Pseudohaliea rubra DSM 19751 TaxID=1265313 RepID=A0A095XWV5_9GAMM|nr:diguanylate cyclase/phosphodiesterase (GGDEF & EAL domain protein) with PAS/PAC sensor(s) [Pseudohaliea rubra DSM 19751]
MLCGFAAAPAVAEPTPLTVGIYELGPARSARLSMAPLSSALKATGAPLSLRFLFLRGPALEAAVAAGTVDLVVTNPYHYLLLRARTSLPPAFASVYVRRADGTEVHRVGGVILVQAGRDDLVTLPDLVGKRVATLGRSDTGGYLAPLAALAEAGVAASSLVMVDYATQPEALAALRAGEVDAAFLRSANYEFFRSSGLLDDGAVRLLGQRDTPGFPFLNSTPLYPQWAVAALPQVDPAVVRLAFGSLLRAQPLAVPAATGYAAGIGLPGDYSAVDAAVRALRLPPYDEVQLLRLDDVLHQYRGELLALAAAFLLVLVLVAGLLRANRAVRAAYRSRRAALEELDEERRHLAELNKNFLIFLDKTTDLVLFKDATGRLLFCSSSFARLTGKEDWRSLVGKTEADLFDAETARHTAEQEARVLRTGEPLLNQVQPLTREDGKPGWMAVSRWPIVGEEEGDSEGLFTIARDITDDYRRQEQLQRTAHFDSITGLPNRALLADRLEQAMAVAERRGTELAVLYLDLDGFKSINDRHGHAAGDRALASVSKVMQASVRRGDTVARVGGDEFVIVLVDLNSRKECLLLVDRLLSRLAEPLALGEDRVALSASAGLSFYGRGVSADAEGLLRQADQAMYQAKNAGKNGYRLYDRQQDARLRAYLEDMGRALDQGQFVLHYQPIVDMQSGELLAVEALLRWQREDRLLGAEEFLPMLKGHPLARRVGDWVLRQAVAQLAGWRAAGEDIAVAVNVTSPQLSRSDFTAGLRELLRFHELDGGDCGLTLEILESSALADREQLQDVMAVCAPLGVRFALDDFGTGYSSLSHLKDLPAERLKIDRRFVRDLFKGADDFAMLSAIVGMARAFGRELVAEGVESAAQGDVLLGLGCRYAQGFAIAPALPPESLLAWRRAWRPPESWAAARPAEAAEALGEPSPAVRALWVALAGATEQLGADRQEGDGASGP